MQEVRNAIAGRSAPRYYILLHSRSTLPLGKTWLSLSWCSFKTTARSSGALRAAHVSCSNAVSFDWSELEHVRNEFPAVTQPPCVMKDNHVLRLHRANRGQLVAPTGRDCDAGWSRRSSQSSWTKFPNFPTDLWHSLQQTKVLVYHIIPYYTISYHIIPYYTIYHHHLLLKGFLR